MTLPTGCLSSSRQNASFIKRKLRPISFTFTMKDLPITTIGEMFASAKQYSLRLTSLRLMQYTSALQNFGGTACRVINLVVSNSNGERIVYSLTPPNSKTQDFR